MAEDRMLNDEILLGLIKANAGGGGGTTNYNQLENKPQINSITLSGNKSLADLGIASAQSVSNITNGANINDFAGVESALSGKQNALTAGDYIDITNGEISVNCEIPANNFTYELVTKSTGGNDASMTVKKYANGSLVSSTDYLYDDVRTAVNIDGYFTLQYTSAWQYTLLQASTDHASGYVATWRYDTAVDYTEVFPTEDTSGRKLIIKSEMDAALADKANKADVKNEFIGTLAEWNALSTAQQKAYDTYQITDDYSEALMPNYSTTAQKTGQKWIDGNDVYMVVYQPSSAVVVANNNWTDIGMSASGIGTLLEITGIAADGACCSMVGAKDNGKIICLAGRPDGAFTVVVFVVKYVEPSV